jgi:ProP effector
MRKQVLHPRTAVINQKQKNQSKKDRYKALRWLAEKFPLVFDNTKQIRPLKIGIMLDVLQYADEAAKDDISKSKLREAVVLFTRRLDYLSCLKAREMRVDLLGQPTSIVTEEDSESANLKIKKRIEKAVKNIRTVATESSVKNQANKKKNVFAPSYKEDLYPHSAFAKETPIVSAPVVTVKQKVSRVYDPDAIARLKARLGLESAQKQTD